MQSPASRIIYFAAFIAVGIGLSGLAAPALAENKPAAKAAAKKAPASIVGMWLQETPPARFAVKPGPKAGQVIFSIPADLMKLPQQDYVLTRRSDTVWAFNAPDLPEVTFTLVSASKAEVNMRGSGKTSKGSWFVFQNMVLIRP